jgi:hypothetical protein
MAIETIPIHIERAREGFPFDVRVTDLTAWPDQELYFHFEYNERMRRWIFEAMHVDGMQVIPRSVATLGRQYSFWPYCLFEFRETEEEYNAITKENLGDDIVLGIFPGPAGGSFLPEAGISQEREDFLLRRHEFFPHRGRKTVINIPEEIESLADD